MHVKRKSKFVVPDQDAKSGDHITILDEGEEGEWGYVFKVSTPAGEEKQLRLNGTSLKNLINAWGDETEKWVGKSAKVIINTSFAFGKETQYIVLTPKE